MKKLNWKKVQKLIRKFKTMSKDEFIDYAAKNLAKSEEHTIAISDQIFADKIDIVDILKKVNK